MEYKKKNINKKVGKENSRTRHNCGGNPTNTEKEEGQIIRNPIELVEFLGKTIISGFFSLLRRMESSSPPADDGSRNGEPEQQIFRKRRSR